MKVYVLTFDNEDFGGSVVGVFSSYSAMVTHLKDEYDFESPTTGWSDNEGGAFNYRLPEKGVSYFVEYVEYDLIGEHPVKTDKLEIEL